ncbi:MAG: hypothetical protein LUF78_06475 [Clostridiales bacterium]|nr:hypothetical protein [Clostridiales bacterium]
MYKKEIEGWLKHYDFIFLDLICLQVAFELAYVFSRQGINLYHQILYRNMDIFLTLTDVIIIFSLGTLKRVLKRGKHEEFITTMRHVAVLFALSLLYLFVLQQGISYSRRVLFLAFIFYAFITYLIRELWKQQLRKKW